MNIKKKGMDETKKIMIMAALFVYAPNLVAVNYISFDNPFLASAYKKVYELSMQIVGDLAALQQGTLLAHDQSFLQDAIAGRITRLSDSAQELCNDCAHGKPLFVRDLEDVIGSIAFIIDICKEQLPTRSYQCVNNLLKDINNRLEQLLL